MRVLAFPADEGGCGFYRITEPARVLAGQGADVEVRRDITWPVIHGSDGRPHRLAEAPDADVVVLQRPLARWKSDLVRCLQRAGVAVVVELDDDFGSIHPGNGAWADAHPQWMAEAETRERGIAAIERIRRGGRTWWRAPGVISHNANVWLRRACEHADLVTVTTPALAERYAPHGRAAVLPNLVPERYLSVKVADRKGVVVGWAGTRATHPDDLEVTGGGVGRAIDRAGARCAVVGDGEGVADALGVGSVAVSGWLPMRRYVEAVAGLDVGVVPLAASRFNEAKSALKMCEMAAVGVPVVASPTPDNVRMFAEGVGELASTPDEWEAAVLSLVRAPERRAHAAGAGREVMADHTYEAHAGRWWDAWGQAMANRATDREVAA